MLLEYVWCDKVDVYGKNSSENASVRKYVCFACLPNVSSCFGLTVGTGLGFLGYELLIGFPVEVWRVAYVMDELVHGSDFTNTLFRYELFMMVVGLNKRLFIWH